MNTTSTASKRYIALDFEYANGDKASICQYGLAFEDGSTETGYVQLHPTVAEHTNGRYNGGITEEQTSAGIPFAELYARLAALTADGNTVLVAHDLKSDRKAWLRTQALHGMPALRLSWVDSLHIARLELGCGKSGGGVKAMAQRYAMEINHHNPVDDARVALQVILRNPAPKNILRDR